ncbi:MAG: hypothetical protein WA117_20775 [Verrucomicrobiia bacterium]
MKPIVEVLKVINQMQADGVIEKYAIGGAVGATFYLEPSATLDIDIFLTLQNAPGSRLITLAPIHEYLTAPSRGYKMEKEYVVIEGWPVQFLPPSDALGEEALTQAVETKVDGIRTRVMTAEHLVALALKLGRAKDFARILQFIENGAIKPGKLARVLSRHKLLAKWQEFERKFGRNKS